jgi:hypothetical protein
LGDFCINVGKRSLGPALELQKSLLKQVDSGIVSFCYDFPNAGMMAIYKRLGILPFGQMVRMAKPLRLDRQIKKYITKPGIARRLSSISNFILNLGDRKRRSGRDLVFSLHEGPCQDEFTAVSRDIRGSYGACVVRSADYLNWRFLSNPYCEYHLMTARRAGALMAYAIFTESDGNGAIVDLFGIEDDAVLSGLVDSVVRLFRIRGMMTVSVALLDCHRWRPIFETRGFRARETKPIILFPLHASGDKQVSSQCRNWLFMDGDRDS